MAFAPSSSGKEGQMAEPEMETPKTIEPAAKGPEVVAGGSLRIKDMPKQSRSFYSHLYAPKIDDFKNDKPPTIAVKELDPNSKSLFHDADDSGDVRRAILTRATLHIPAIKSAFPLTATLRDEKGPLANKIIVGEKEPVNAVIAAASQDREIVLFERDPESLYDTKAAAHGSTKPEELKVKLISYEGKKVACMIKGSSLAGICCNEGNQAIFRERNGLAPDYKLVNSNTPTHEIYVHADYAMDFTKNYLQKIEESNANLEAMHTNLKAVKVQFNPLLRDWNNAATHPKIANMHSSITSVSGAKELDMTVGLNLEFILPTSNECKQFIASLMPESHLHNPPARPVEQIWDPKAIEN